MRKRNAVMRKRPIMSPRKATCTRCAHVWIPSVPSPKRCPACTSPYWWVEKGKLPQGAAGHRK